MVEDGLRQPVTKGTPQGAVISPLLANITFITFTIYGPVNGGDAMRTVR